MSNDDLLTIVGVIGGIGNGVSRYLFAYLGFFGTYCLIKQDTNL